jgi:hypothetical protein|tara:strand:- start:365 stop:775 length:411 start_codon:yes stop_codon:yes gene_type:complete
LDIALVLNILVPSIAVSCISAFGFIAYKHPKDYQVLSAYLYLILLGLFVTIAIWNSAVEAAFRAAYGAFRQTVLNGENASAHEMATLAEDAIMAQKIEPIGLYLLLFVGVTFLVLMLGFIASNLNKEDDDDDNHGP